ncbi:MAG: hypothetical protein ABMA14_18995 [Hyphomonadaceae bacterium]
MQRSALIAACLLALSACTPKAEELDGAPADKAGPSGPVADDGSLAGGGDKPATVTLLPGVFDVTLPPGALVVKDCEKVIASDYDKPPSMTCVAVVSFGATAVTASSDVDSLVLNAFDAAGWKAVRAAGAVRYFERPKGQTDCADVAVMTVLEGKTLAAVQKAANAPPPPADQAWRGYSIPASTHEACGADRMKP